jgi:tRNA nucleotidyltransferase (CCA-adding enzyme)
MMIDLPEQIWDLRDAFRAQGFDIRLVGGAVRDLVAGVEPKDWDMHTDANPEECMKIYDQLGVKWVATGIQHGTISVIVNSIAYEITSLRADVKTDGRHAQVSYTRDWITDCERRDFTINSMSMTFEGELFDPFQGAQDLAQGMVRFVGAAEARIQEDYLRILRWFRFRGRFGFKVCLEAALAVQKHKAGLAHISRERVWSEIQRILIGQKPVTLMLDMYSLDLEAELNLPPAGDHFLPDGMEHGVQVSKLSKNPITMMVALFGADSVAMLKTWKASGAEIQLSERLAQAQADNMSAWTVRAEQGWCLDHARELAVLQRMDQLGLLMLEHWDPPVFPVKGQDVLDMGVKPGVQVGQMLSHLKQVWAQSSYTLGKQELMNLIKK